MQRTLTPPQYTLFTQYSSKSLEIMSRMRLWMDALLCKDKDPVQAVKLLEKILSAYEGIEKLSPIYLLQIIREENKNNMKLCEQISNLLKNKFTYLELPAYVNQLWHAASPNHLHAVDIQMQLCAFLKYSIIAERLHEYQVMLIKRFLQNCFHISDGWVRMISEFFIKSIPYAYQEAWVEMQCSKAEPTQLASISLADQLQIVKNFEKMYQWKKPVYHHSILKGLGNLYANSKFNQVRENALKLLQYVKANPVLNHAPAVSQDSKTQPVETKVDSAGPGPRRDVFFGEKCQRFYSPDRPPVNPYDKVLLLLYKILTQDLFTNDLYLQTLKLMIQQNHIYFRRPYNAPVVHFDDHVNYIKACEESIFAIQYHARTELVLHKRDFIIREVDISDECKTLLTILKNISTKPECLAMVEENLDQFEKSYQLIKCI